MLSRGEVDLAPYDEGTAESVHGLLDRAGEVSPVNVQDVFAVNAEFLRRTLNEVIHRLQIRSYCLHMPRAD